MKILNIGASGFLGTKLMKVLSDKFNIYGTYHSNKISGLLSLDLKKPEQIKAILNKLNPEIIIDSSGITNVDYCEKHREEAFNANVIGIRNLLNIIKKQTKLVYISTNYVFDGKKGNYTEYNQKKPVNYYGTTKSVAEELVKKHSNYLIIRPCNLYGYNNHSDKENFFRYVYENLKQNRKIGVVTDQVANPALIDDIAFVLETLINQNKKGIFHVTGPEKISMYDFAERIAAEFSFNSALIEPTTTKKLFNNAERPKKIDLNISKLKKLGIKTSDINKGLKIINGQLS